MYLLNWGVQGGSREGLSGQIYCSPFPCDVNISSLWLAFCFRISLLGISLLNFCLSLWDSAKTCARAGWVGRGHIKRLNQRCKPKRKEMVCIQKADWFLSSGCWILVFSPVARGWPLYPGAGLFWACLWLPGLCAGAASWKWLLRDSQVQEASSSCVGLCHRGGDAWDADKWYEYYTDNGYLLIKSGEIYLFSAEGWQTQQLDFPVKKFKGLLGMETATWSMNIL